MSKTELSLEDLRILSVFAEVGKQQEAAEAVGVTEAKASRALGELRKRYGLLRPQKRGRHNHLSERGEQALPAIRELLRQHDALQHWLAGFAPAPQVVALGLGTTAAHYYLPAAQASFESTCPGWNVDAVVLRGRQRVRGVVAGTLDLAIVSHRVEQIRVIAGDKSRIIVEELVEDPLCLLGHYQSSAGKRLRDLGLAGQRLTPQHLTQFHLLGLDSRSGVRQQMEQRVRGLHFRETVGGWLAAKEFARHGLGAVVLPLSVLQPNDRDEFEIRMLDGTFTIRHHLLHRDIELSEGVAAMKQALLQAVKARCQEARRLWHGVLPAD